MPTANGLTWTAYVKAYWPIVLALLLATAYVNQRLEAAPAKQLRIDASIAKAMLPVYQQLATKAEASSVPPQSVIDDISEIKATLIRLEERQVEHLREEH